MSLKFSLDPATGVVKPPVTVFNGGKRSRRSKRKTLKGRKGRKTRKTMKQRRRQ